MIPIRSLDDLMEAAHGYQRSMALFTALKLGVFSSLARGGADAATVARRVAADPRRLAVLLDGLTAMGLLRKTGVRYRNGEAASSFLTDGPRTKSAILLHHRDCWRDWSRLEETVRGGRKGRPLGGDDQENFIRGMEDNARERAAHVAGRFRLRPGERLLDLGGGPGTYAVEWARRCPGAAVTLFDTAGTIRITRRVLEEKGATGIVRLIEGDFLADPLGGPYDFVWISQILHAYSEKDCRALLRKARKALAPGGRVAVQEFLVDEGGASPPGPAFFSVHMVAVTSGGRAYSAREVAGMLRAAGFVKTAFAGRDARGVGIVTARA
ncbi:MAG TPA: methyltransferase [Candidatus Deferrimicrobium sp.]